MSSLEGAIRQAIMQYGQGLDIELEWGDRYSNVYNNTSQTWINVPTPVLKKIKVRWVDGPKDPATNTSEIN